MSTNDSPPEPSRGHYETGTQPEDCEECVCADCAAWVGAREITRCGGPCATCVAEGPSQ
ncbi:hypothetical protein [Amycolatopsis pithecellobii]|uniref:Uncharacterized protein n=1 Tax=Amycolatopsis pithecellobii TaxID=664692 RepID=A0A6N7Z7I6_9PSEU|nr:hypothetical protein [Amycolatopsis pithecellobii]MTD57174.1 hypothetical protein [Amycolatopsis pithecellobii]